MRELKQIYHIGSPMDYITYQAYTMEDEVVDPFKAVAGAFDMKMGNLKEALHNNTPCTISGEDCLDQVLLGARPHPRY